MDLTHLVLARAVTLHRARALGAERWWLGAVVTRFLLVGGLLFVASEVARRVRNPAGEREALTAARPRDEGRPEIVWSSERIRQLHWEFVERFSRPPTRDELVTVMRQSTDEEILETEARRVALGFGDHGIRARVVQKMRAVSPASGKAEEDLYREGLDLGLDDDVVVRRLLREKMRMLLARAPGDDVVEEEDVRAYVDRHRDTFVRAEAVTFSHVFLSSRVYGERLRAWAEETLNDVRARGVPPAAVEGLSDPFPLGMRLAGWSRAAVSRHFGRAFADEIFALESRRWCGPLASALGVHLVWVHERIPEALPPLEVLWPAVATSIREERAAQRIARGLDDLRSRYRVRIGPSAEMSEESVSWAR